MNPLRPFFDTSRFIFRRAAQRLSRQVPDVPELKDVARTHHFSLPDATLTCFEVRSEVEDDSLPELSVMFAHGYTLSARSWVFQAEALRKVPNLRMLIPDLRGHGESTADSDALTVQKTGTDTLHILRELAPSGPVLLVGHSLGVQTVLSAMEQGDDQFRERVVGVALVNGAITEFASAGVTQVLDSGPVQIMRRIGRRLPRLAEWVKNKVDWILEPFIASFVYHGELEEGISAEYDVVEYHAQDIERCTMTTVLGFLDDLVDNDETDAAPLLAEVPGVVMVGQMDNVTPASQTRAIADMWPKAKLREVPDTGHMLPMEAPEKVNRELIELIELIRGGH